MPTCYNCRKTVSWLAKSCAYCGITFTRGTWRTQTDLISPSAHGWGLRAATYNGVAFRGGALLVPIWLPLILGIMAGPQPGGDSVGLVLLLAPFVFIPGVYTIANHAAWRKRTRLVVCVIYVVAAQLVAFLMLSVVEGLWQA